MHNSEIIGFVGAWEILAQGAYHFDNVINARKVRYFWGEVSRRRGAWAPDPFVQGRIPPAQIEHINACHPNLMHRIKKYMFRFEMEPGRFGYQRPAA